MSLNEQVPVSEEFKKLEADSRVDGASETTQSLVFRLIKEAKDHYENELLDGQVEATNFFYGREFGDEQDGRSKVISTEVRDAIEAIMPSLLRIFLGSDSACEFKPCSADDVQLAKQQTDVVQYYLREENDGYITLMAAFDDALLRRIGAVKAWYEKLRVVKGEKYTGLRAEAIAQLLEVKDVEEVKGSLRESEASTPELPLFDVDIRRSGYQCKLRIQAVPNEEFVYSPGEARLEDCRCVAHIREMKVSDLIAMGFDADEVKAAAGKVDRITGGDLFDARQFSGTDPRSGADGEGDLSTRTVQYAEAYILADIDEDDYAERRVFHCVGPTYKILNGDGDGEVVDELPLVAFTPRPLPHMIAGFSVHDMTRDLQRISSQIERGMLDSLALAIENKLIVQEGKVNIKDLLSPELLNIVRCTGDPNQVVREIKHTFVGPDALPVLEYFVGKRQERMGITRASQGLDADSLQSSTKQAVAGTFAAAQQRIEMIARNLAETGMKPLFRLISRLLIRHQNEPLVVRLRGQYVQVDPRSWNANADVVVNVGIGSGSFEEKLQALQLVVTDQNELMANGAPLVSWENMRATRARILELMGFRNVDEFYQPFGAQQQQELDAAKKNAPPTQDPNMALVEVEKTRVQGQQQIAQAKFQMDQQIAQFKAQMDQQSEQAKLTLEQLKVKLADDLARERLAREMALKEYEIELSNQADIRDSELKAKVAEDRAAMGGSEA